MRRILVVIVAVNLAALGLAAVAGILPPRLLDFVLPELSGHPLIHVAGEGTWEISITNSLFTMWLVMALLVGGALFLTRDLREHPGPRQNVVELLVQAFTDFVEGVGGHGSLRYVPLFGTLFLFILMSNYLGLVPLVGQPMDLPVIGHAEPLRAPSSDYHVTVGLALVGFVIYQWQGIRKHGLSYFGRFLNLSGFREGFPQALFMGPIMLFVGVIEFFSELFRILTLTLRLWGNILGGEIALAVMASLVVVPVLAFPFIGLELLVGLVQSLIFAVLVLVYIVLAIESHDEEHGPADAETVREVAHA